jgi:hypothetical protein
METLPKKRRTKKQPKITEEDVQNVIEDIPITIEEDKDVVEEEVKGESEEPKLDEKMEVIEQPVPAHESKNEVKEVENKTNPLLYKSLLNLLIIISARPEILNAYEFNNNEILSLLLKENPEFFVLLEESFKKIISDNSIDSNDVPELMRILSILYEIIINLDVRMETNEISNICGELLKFFFYVTFTEGIIAVDESMVSCFNSLMNSSISLMVLKTPIKKSVVIDDIKDNNVVPNPKKSWLGCF